MSSFLVRKADGDTEAFRPEKLKLSLKRAGASPLIIRKIVERIQAEATDTVITTAEIYKNAFRLLKKEKLGVASRYSLKRAIFDLGPTGFPFEDFVAQIMISQGYTATTGMLLKGACAEHEVDMIAHKDDSRIGAEMKFHNSPGMKTDLKVALYVAARFQDLNQKLEARSKPFTESWLVTNTKFTSQARHYGTCVGLKLIAWSYPRSGNLQDMIESSGLHPITALTSLTKTQKQRLLKEGQVLCRQLINNRTLLETHGVPKNKINRVLAETNTICGV